jgi:hypothetical protein
VKIQLLSIAVALAFAAGAQAQGTSQRQVKNADQDRIEAEYKVAKEKCNALKENAQDICMVEAKGAQMIANAELDARNAKDPARAKRKVQRVKANAAYDVAKERCDDKQGNDKDVCIREAKAAHARAKADIKRADAKSAGTGSTK